MTLPRNNKSSDTGDPVFDAAAYGDREVLSEDGFRRRIAIERKRTERSREPFLLMLLEAAQRRTATRPTRRSTAF